MGTPRNRPERKASSFYEGPAIYRCPTQEALNDNARGGSLALLKAIERAGIRP